MHKKESLSTFASYECLLKQDVLDLGPVVFGVVAETIAGCFRLGPVHFADATNEHLERIDAQLASRLDHYVAAENVARIVDVFVVVKVDLDVF